MKHQIRARALLIALSGFLVLPLPLAAAEVEVPDIETRIRNSGDDIPGPAVPHIPGPAEPALPPNPEPERAPSAQGEAPAPEPVAPAQIAAATQAPSPAPPAESLLSGSARLGAGYPGSLSGDLSIDRKAESIPGFSLDFTHDSADGYGAHRPGTGWFDRGTSLGAVLRSAGGPRGWELGVLLAERSDGFQDRNPDYYSLTTRRAEWSALVRGVPLGHSAFSVSADIAGSAFSSFAEQAGALTPPAFPVEGSDGYHLVPRASVNWSSGAFDADLAGTYRYETIAGTGESHAVSGELTLGWRSGPFAVSGALAAAGDSADGFLAPFSIGASRESPDSVLRSVKLTGGLSRDVYSPASLAGDEPFADRSALSVHAADWNASASVRLAPVAPVSLDASVLWRSTAFGRGVLALSDRLDAAGLVPTERVSRDSLETNAAAAWEVPGFSSSLGWKAEWLDTVPRGSRHTVDAGVRLFDAGPDRIWEIGADAEFALDPAAVPLLGAEATYWPARDLSVTVSLADCVSLFAGTVRRRNDLYATRSGALGVSARVNF